MSTWTCITKKEKKNPCACDVQMVTRGMDNNAEVSSSGPSSFIYFKCQVSFLTFVQYFA